MKQLVRYTSNALQALMLGVAVVAVAGFGLMHYGYIPKITPYIVLSGSMEPGIPVGSVVVVRAREAAYQVGEVITFAQKQGEPVTHRVVALEQVDGETVYQTKGDANADPDFSYTHPKNVIGSVVWTIPYVGKVASLAKTPAGFIALIIIPATIVVYEELRGIKKEIAKLWNKVFPKPSQIQAGSQLPNNSNHIPPAPISSVTPWSFSRYADLLPKPLALAYQPKLVVKKPTNYMMYLGLIPIVVATTIGVALTGSYFSDTEVSQGNILGVAEAFINPEPDELVSPQSLSEPPAEPELETVSLPEPSPSPTPEPETDPTASQSATIDNQE